MIGTVVGSYRVQQRLGQGGVGSVYRVEHTVLGTAHALKVLHQPNERARQRLIEEGRIQATLRHPNIVSVRDVLDVAGQPGLLMDLIEGPTLASLLAGGPLAHEAIGAIGGGILAGMAEAHRRGLVHRDLKPANVLLAVEHGVVVAKVADFGLARAESGGAGMTSSGASLGTPRYMAPEQVRDPRDVDASSDVWALGAMLYELCCGQPAFGASDLLKLYNDIGAAHFVAIEEENPNLPLGWIHAIAAAMQVDRSARPENATALATLWGESPPWSADPDVVAKLMAMAPKLEDDDVADVTWSGGTLDSNMPPPPAPGVLASLPRGEVVPSSPKPSPLAWGLGALGVGFVALSLALVWIRPPQPPPPAPVPSPAVPTANPVAAPVPTVSPRARLVAKAKEAFANVDLQRALENAEYAAPVAETDDPQLLVAVSYLAIGHRTMAMEELHRGRGRPLVIGLTRALADPAEGDPGLLAAGHPAALLYRLLAGPMDPEGDAALLAGLSAALPDRALVSWAKAVEARRRGDLPQAEEYLNHAIRITGGNPFTELERALWLRAAGRLGEAAAVIDAVVADKPPSNAWAVRALIDEELHRTVQAVESQKMVRRGAVSKKADFEVALVDLHLQNGDADAAFEAFARAESMLSPFDGSGEVNTYRMEMHTEAVRLAALLGHRPGLQASQQALRMMAETPMVSWVEGEIDVRIDVAAALWLHLQGDSSAAQRLLDDMPEDGPALPAHAALRDVLTGADARVRPTLLP